MTKRTFSIIFFNLLMLLGEFVVVSRNFLNLNFLNLYQTPIKLGLSWFFFVFWAGCLIYFNNYLIQVLIREMRHNEALRIQNPEIDNVQEALDKLVDSKRYNPKLANAIDQVIERLNSFQMKKDIMNQLLANNGQKAKDWNFIIEFNAESEKEILAFVRQVIDSGIVFDDPNESIGSDMFNKSQSQINEYNQGIIEILLKYDEFLHVVKEVLEKKLHSTALVATDSLDITIKSVKQVYGIGEYGIDPLEELMAKYENGNGGVKANEKTS